MKSAGSFKFGRWSLRALSLFLVGVLVWGLLPDVRAFEPICGLTEHVHDQSCYATYGENVLKCDYEQFIHQHDDSCYAADGSLACMKADFVLHKHDSSCYDASGNLVCSIPERDESVHGLENYSDCPDAVCVYKPYFSHVHTAACYKDEQVLVCGLESDPDAHVHTDACYEDKLTCGIEILYDAEDAGTGLQDESQNETQDESQSESQLDASGESDDSVPLAHVHGPSCYTRELICGQDEAGHVHGDDCYETNRVLVCDAGGSDLSQDVDSNRVVCQHYTYELHEHDSGCYDSDGRVICGKYELRRHEHNSTCFEREILDYNSDVPTCNHDEHKHGISCYFKDKTEELQAFLDGYDAFMQEVDFGSLNPENETDVMALAQGAFSVLKLSELLDKDVLKLESVQEMLANLKKYIPDGFTGEGADVLTPDNEASIEGFSIPVGFDVVAPLSAGGLYADIAVKKVSGSGELHADAYPYRVTLASDGSDRTLPDVSVSAPGDYVLEYSMSSCSDSCIVDTRVWTVKLTVLEDSAVLSDVKMVENADAGGSIPAAAVDAFTYVLNSLVFDGDAQPDAKAIRFMLRPGPSMMKSYSNATKMQARKIMSKMTLEQKAGQMLLVHFSDAGYSWQTLIDTYHVGGLILFDVDTTGVAGNYNAHGDVSKYNPTTMRSLLADVQSRGKSANNNIGMLISVDEEGGKRSNGTYINRLSTHPQYRSTPFKSPQDMYNAGGYEYIYSQEVEKGEFLIDLGFNMNHGPVLDLSQTGYVSGRSFGPDGLPAAEYAVNSIRGLHDGGVGISMKHFPGYGNSSSDTHTSFAYNDLTESEMQYNDLVPFYAGMAAGGDTLMVTHNAIGYLHDFNPSNIDAASCDPKVYELARSMGYDGLILTDDLNMGAITTKYGSGAVRAIQSGADIALTGNKADVPAVINAVKSGMISEARVDESVERVLCWKIEHGLIDGVEAPPVDETNNTVLLDASGIEIQTGDLRSMLAAAEPGYTVRLLDDIEFDSGSGIEIVKPDITLDLAGYNLSITGTTGFVIKYGAELVVTDSCSDNIDPVSGLNATWNCNSDSFVINESDMTASWPSASRGSVSQPDKSVCNLDLSGFGWLDFHGTTCFSVGNGGRLDLASGVIMGASTGNYIDGARGLGDTDQVSNVRLSGAWLFDISAGENLISVPSWRSSAANLPDGLGMHMTGGGIVGCASQQNLIDVKNAELSISAGYIAGNRVTGSDNSEHDSYGIIVVRRSEEFLGEDFGGDVLIQNVEFSSNTAHHVMYFHGTAETVASGSNAREYKDLGCQVDIKNCVFVRDSGIRVRVLNRPMSVSGCTAVDSVDSNVLVKVSYSGPSAALKISGCALECYSGLRIEEMAGSHSVSNCWFGNLHGGGSRFIDIVGPYSESMLTVSDLNMVGYSESSTSIEAIKFDSLGRLFLRDVSYHVGDKDVLSIRPSKLFTDSASCALDGLVRIRTSDEGITRNNRFFISERLDPDSEIGVKFSYSFDDSMEIILCTGGSGVDLNGLQKCFHVPDGLKTWYDSEFNVIRVGTAAHYVPGEDATDISGVELQYYGYMKMADSARQDSLSTMLTTMDCSKAGGGGSAMAFNGSAYLPREAQVPVGQYSGVWAIRNVYLEPVDGNYVVKSHMALRPVYAERVFDNSDPAIGNTGDFEDIAVLLNKKLSDFNMFKQSEDSHDVKELWVLKDGKSKDSTNPADWDVIPWSENLYFTVDAQDVDSNAILLRSNLIIRFVAEPLESKRSFRVMFYDYDVSDGVNPGSGDWNTNKKGINSTSNYSGSGGHYAFGNANLLVKHGYEADTHGGRPFNQANRVGNWKEVKSECFKYCAFGIVQGLDSDGNLIWANDVQHPNLFNDGSAIGKTAYANSELVFEKVGSTLTLESVRAVGPDSPCTPDGKNLRFFNQYSSVWANNFWPMDSVSSAGGTGHDPVFGETAGTITNGLSDDGTNHNSYFGMHLTVQFDLNEDYVAPMYYQFFGDDDLWVFLDGELICDLGGVHQSAGCYVDLRDYLPVGPDTTGPHMLTVYYTERGASGSSCWMQMVLPTNARAVPDVPEDVVTYGNMHITKTVEGIDDWSEPFPMKVEYYDASGNLLPETVKYPCEGLGDLTAVGSGDIVNLIANTPVWLRHVPVGCSVVITEQLNGNKHWTLIQDDGSHVNPRVSHDVVFGDNELLLTNQYNPGGCLRIAKSVVDGENHVMTDCSEEFLFGVSLYNADKTPHAGRYAYSIYRLDSETSEPFGEALSTGVLWHGCPAIRIPANCILVTDYIPEVVTYEVQEMAADASVRGYALAWAEDNTGVVDFDVQDAKFTNAPIEDMPKLPSAGGIGVFRYLASGVSLLGLVLIFIYSRRSKKYST